jgi:hypothetical protein
VTTNSVQLARSTARDADDTTRIKPGSFVGVISFFADRSPVRHPWRVVTPPGLRMDQAHGP